LKYVPLKGAWLLFAFHFVMTDFCTPALLLLLLAGAARGTETRLVVPDNAALYGRSAVEVRGSSMFPLIAPGTELLLLKGYYSDNVPQRGDIVAYNYAGNKWPVVKRILGIPGDFWSLKEEKAWYRIILNGKTLKNSAGMEYRVLQNSAKRLKLYSTTYPTIPKDAYLLLGDDISGSTDSTVFGLVARQDLAGRLVRIVK
jgi:signal peptidase I